MNINFKYRQISFPATVVCYTAVHLCLHTAQADYPQDAQISREQAVKLHRYKSHKILNVIAF